MNKNPNLEQNEHKQVNNGAQKKRHNEASGQGHGNVVPVQDGVYGRPTGRVINQGQDDVGSGKQIWLVQMQKSGGFGTDKDVGDGEKRVDHVSYNAWWIQP